VHSKQQQDVKEQMYGFWSQELFPLMMKELKGCLTASKKNWAAMKARQAKQQAERVMAAATTRRQRAAAAALRTIETRTAVAATVAGKESGKMRGGATARQTNKEKKGCTAGASPPW